MLIVLSFANSDVIAKGAFQSGQGLYKHWLTGIAAIHSAN